MDTPPPPYATASHPLTQQDERIIAALAHISVLLPLIGVIAPIIIWVTQKDRSRFVAFQALQAIAFQLLMVLVWFGGMACYMGSFFLTFLEAFAANSLNSPGGPPLAFLLPFVVFAGIIIVTGILVIYGIVAAVLTFQGKDFRYALIGRWVERYTQRSAAP